MSYISCSNPPSIHGHASPIYFKSDIDNKEYIIITPRSEGKSVYFYDIEQDKLQKKFRYPSNFKASDHINAIDKARNNLYVLGGFYSVFGKINFKTHHWSLKLNDGTKHEQLKQIYNISDYRLCYPYFINDKELHVLHRGQHLMYNIDDDKFIELSFNDNKCTKYGKLLYVEHLQSKLILFGGDNPMKQRKNKRNLYPLIDHENETNIYFCDTSNRSHTNYKWRVFNAKLEYPLNLRKSHIVLAFNFIVILFDLSRNRISCLDLLLTQEWYETELRMPMYYCIFDDIDCVQTDNNIVHFIRYKTRNGFHIKLSLSQCIPSALKKLYKAHYEKFIMGYVRNKIEKPYKYNVAIPLKKMISAYFPVFLC